MFDWFKKRPRPADGIRLRERDCHSHVIPGVDDGSRSLEMSLAMLTLLREAGAHTIVCTSHVYPGKYDNEPETLARPFEHLCDAARAANIDVQLELGAEHFLDASLEGRIRSGRAIAFGPERYVLFEAHTGEHVPAPLFDAVRAMIDCGLTPLLAHIERYHWLRGAEGDELLEDLRAAGCRFQVNRTVGKVNVPGEGSRGRFLADLLARGWIDEVGSDLHRPTAEGRPFEPGA